MQSLWKENLKEMKVCSNIISKNIKKRDEIEEKLNNRKRKDDKENIEIYS